MRKFPFSTKSVIDSSIFIFRSAGINCFLTACLLLNFNFAVQAQGKLCESVTVTIDNVAFVTLSDSMMNGGGPACLRLRTVLTKEELKLVPKNFRLTKDLHVTLKRFVDQYYRSELTIEDLVDPSLLLETETAYREIEAIFNAQGGGDSY